MSQVCSTLPNIEFALLDANSTGPFNIDDTVEFTCKFGYVTSSNYTFKKPTVTCKLINGIADWEYDDKACKPQTCGDPGWIDNGKYIGYLFTYPNRVSYECNEGFKLEGLSERYCQVSGRWSGILPKCVPIICSNLNVPDNSSITYTKANNYNSEAQYKCHKGFKLDGNEIRTCMQSGVWNGTDPICRKVTCPKPKSYENGHYIPIKDEYFDSDIIFFHCPFTNYTHMVKCLNGRWSSSPLPCVNPNQISNQQNQISNPPNVQQQNPNVQQQNPNQNLNPPNVQQQNPNQNLNPPNVQQQNPNQNLNPQSVQQQNPNPNPNVQQQNPNQNLNPPNQKSNVQQQKLNHKNILQRQVKFFNINDMRIYILMLIFTIITLFIIFIRVI